MSLLPGSDVEKIIAVLEEVEDWEGLAGRLNINIITIRNSCGTRTDQAHCYRRQLVMTYCDRLPSGDPNKVVTDIALILDEMGKKRQAKKLREMSFGGKLLELKGICIIGTISGTLFIISMGRKCYILSCLVHLA